MTPYYTDLTKLVDVYTNVQSNSASWEESADILPTVTNYLSSNNVLLSSATITGTVSAQSYAGPVVLSNTDTSVVVQPGDDLAAKYEQAKLLTPNGNALSTTNRASLIIMPGNYALTSQLAIDTQFVDIIGLGAQKLERGAIPAVNITGNTLNVTANDVRVKGISVGLQTFFVVNNLSLLIIEDCVGTGLGSFAGSFSGSTGIASGTFINCIGGIQSFGSGGSSAGSASGTFINCTAHYSSFGSGGGSTASGTFINCTSTGSYITGGSFSIGLNCDASGTFINCNGAGRDFGGRGLSGANTASGTFINCTSTGDSFGGGSQGIPSGKFYQCRLTSGTFKTVSGGGLMRNCIDGNNDIVDQ